MGTAGIGPTEIARTRSPVCCCLVLSEVEAWECKVGVHNPRQFKGRRRRCSKRIRVVESSQAELLQSKGGAQQGCDELLCRSTPE